MFFTNSSPTEHFIVRNNIFVNTTDWGMRQENNWLDALTLKHNLWFTADKPVYVIDHLREKHFMTEGFQKTIEQYRQDTDSIFAEPIFVDGTAGDYRLAPDSPGYGQNFGRRWK